MAHPAEAEAILRPAVADAVAELGKPVRLEAKTLNVSGEWAFLHARISEPGGEVVRYGGTKFAEDAAHGVRSPIYAALLRGGGEQWSLVVSVVGPTDVAWWNWGEAYSAPAELFELSAD